jgi:hypothetical protein
MRDDTRLTLLSGRYGVFFLHLHLDFSHVYTLMVFLTILAPVSGTDRPEYAGRVHERILFLVTGE